MYFKKNSRSLDNFFLTVGQNNFGNKIPFSISGGVEDIDQLPVPQFRKGFVGCISELSVGKLFSIDLLNRAKNGQNVDSCRETFDF